MRAEIDSNSAANNNFATEPGGISAGSTSCSTEGCQSRQSGKTTFSNWAETEVPVFGEGAYCFRQSHASVANCSAASCVFPPRRNDPRVLMTDWTLFLCQMRQLVDEIRQFKPLSDESLRSCLRKIGI